jgi:hypothetical protein
VRRKLTTKIFPRASRAKRFFLATRWTIKYQTKPAVRPLVFYCPANPLAVLLVAIAQLIANKRDLKKAALEQRRDKTRALKRGMMQELLTGRTRLI